MCKSALAAEGIDFNVVHVIADEHRDVQLKVNQKQGLFLSTAPLQGALTIEERSQRRPRHHDPLRTNGRVACSFASVPALSTHCQESRKVPRICRAAVSLHTLESLIE